MRRNGPVLIALTLMFCTALAQAAPPQAAATVSSPAAAASVAVHASATPRISARRQFQHDLISILALRSAARPLLGAALLARPLQPAAKALDFHHLITRAAAAPQAGPDVAWVRLGDCDAQTGSCPNPDALQALEKQAPDNAAVWLLVFGKAMHDGHHEQADQALAKAAAAGKYDDYTGQSLQALAYAVTALPPPAPTLSGRGTPVAQVAALRVMMVFGIGSAQPVPELHVAAKRCAPDAADDDTTLRSRCLALAKVLVWGSSPLARSLGLHLRATLAAADEDREDARSAMRDLTWQVQSFARLTARAGSDRKVADRLLGLARKGGTEMSLMLAALHAFDMPVQAPAGWKPRHPASVRSSAGADH